MPKSKKTNELAAYGVADATITDLATRKKDGTEILDFLETAKISSPSRREWASEKFSEVRSIVKELDAQRTAITKPILAAKAGVDKLFMPTIKLFEKAEGTLRRLIADYDRAAAIAEDAALQAAEKAFEAGDEEAGQAALAKVASAPVEASGDSTTKTWAFEVTDFGGLADEYKLANDAAIKAFVKAHLATGSTEKPNLPGVTFTRDVALRAKAV